MHHQFGDLLNGSDLVQLFDIPTRQQNTLDLALSNNPSSITDTSVLHGVYDHECP